MKFRPLFFTSAVVSLFFVKSTQGFAQIALSDIADNLNEFSDDMAGALPFMASIGLEWSAPYIGELIDITPHWGMGITIGATTLKLDKLNILLEDFGYQADDGFVDKQLLPAYVVNARIGGFRMLPFDIGIKWGWLPYAPIFKNDISYEAVVYGLDFRWELMRDWGVRPGISLGFEASRATGGLRAKAPLNLNIYPGNSIIKIVTSGDATIGPVWEAWVFDAKLHIAKKFWEPRFTVFGVARAGAALTRTGFQIAGTGRDVVFTDGTPANTIALEDLSNDYRGQVVEVLEIVSGNDMTFEIDDQKITGWIDRFGINLNLHVGVALNFDRIRLDMALMADIIHFELGASVGVRYQQ